MKIKDVDHIKISGGILKVKTIKDVRDKRDFFHLEDDTVINCYEADNFHGFVYDY